MAQNQTMTEKNLAVALLNAHKLSAASLTNLVLESAAPALRQDAIQILYRTFQHQKMIWDYMNNKGYYQVEMAPAREINQARQQMQEKGLQ